MIDIGMDKKRSQRWPMRRKKNKKKCYPSLLQVYIFWKGEMQKQINRAKSPWITQLSFFKASYRFLLETCHAPGDPWGKAIFGPSAIN